MKQYQCGNDLLRLPLYIREDTLSDEQRGHLLDVFTKDMGATFFRDKALFLDVLNDYRFKASNPYNFHAGTYIGVFVNNEGHVRFTSSVEVPGGSTVYAYDQLIELMDNLDQPLTLI